MKFFLFFLSFLSCGSLFADSSTPRVLVSVAPYKQWIEKIAGETVQVQLMVPAGASSHTYEPTPRQMISAGEAVAWFRIGEPFEERAIRALINHHPLLKIIDLREGVDLIRHDHPGHKGCCPGCIDLHFWLSARQAQRQAETIFNALKTLVPANEKQYEENFTKLKNELIELDQTIRTLLSPLKNRKILVSHPAYAYFCRDYALQQYSIEVEGKDPTPQQLTNLLNLAKEGHFRTIFIQMQYSNKAAKLVADTINAHLVVLDPYAEDYFKSMIQIAEAFAKKDAS